MLITDGETKSLYVTGTNNEYVLYRIYNSGSRQVVLGGAVTDALEPGDVLDIHINQNLTVTAPNSNNTNNAIVEWSVVAK